jgi:hypothetical protein
MRINLIGMYNPLPKYIGKWASHATAATANKFVDLKIGSSEKLRKAGTTERSNAVSDFLAWHSKHFPLHQQLCRQSLTQFMSGDAVDVFAHAENPILMCHSRK